MQNAVNLQQLAALASRDEAPHLALLLEGLVERVQALERRLDAIQMESGSDVLAVGSVEDFDWEETHT